MLKQSEEYGFLKEAPAHILQQKLRDLDKAYTDGFDKKQPAKRLPTKRKKALHSTFRFPDPKQIHFNNPQIRLPKVGWVGFFKSKKIEGTVKNVSLSQKSGHWYMAVQVEQNIEEKKHKSQSIVGLDLGIAKFVTTVTKETAKQ